jgi:hypothetical protein
VTVTIKSLTSRTRAHLDFRGTPETDRGADWT